MPFLRSLSAIACVLMAFSATGFSKNSSASGSELIAREQALLDAIRHNDGSMIRSMIADSVVIISTGRRLHTDNYDRSLALLKVNEATLDDFNVVMLDENSGIVTCKIRFAGSYNKKQASGTHYVSSGWARRDGNWQLVFHHDSPAKH